MKWTLYYFMTSANIFYFIPKLHLIIFQYFVKQNVDTLCEDLIYTYIDE